MTSKTVAVIQAPPLFVARDDAATCLSVSETTLEQLVRTGTLKPPRVISKGRTGWLYRELLEFAESRPVSDLKPGPGRRRAVPGEQPTG